MPIDDIDLIIDEILSEPKFNSYKDEPIIYKASQMKSFTPLKYAELDKLNMSLASKHVTNEEIFYKQAKFMEDFEDDFEFRGSFFSYFPSYQIMNRQQLRGYFSWRTKYRNGIIEKTQSSFLFVYIYELINLIGVKEPIDGFNKLKKLGDDYRENHSMLDKYLRVWMIDYVVYYDLEFSLIDEFAQKEVTDPYDTLVKKSNYNIKNSKFINEHSDDFKLIVRRSCETLTNNLKKDFIQTLLGEMCERECNLFPNTLFYNREVKKDKEYLLALDLKYSVKNNKWYKETLIASEKSKNNVGLILREIDSLMRIAYNYKYKIKGHNTVYSAVIEEVINQFLLEKKALNAPKIEIEFSKLENIRKSALEIQNKLLVEDEIIEEEVAEAVEEDTLLDTHELKVLQFVLLEEDYQKYARENKIMISVIIDSINEKLFDNFGDTVIEFTDKADVIEDYIEELKEMFL